MDFGSSPSDPKTTRACAAPPAHPRSPQAAGEAIFTPNAAFLGCFPPFFQLQTASRRERGSPGASPGPALVKLVPVSLSAAPRALSRGSAAFIPFFYSLFYSRGCSIRPGCLLQAPFSALIPSALGASPSPLGSLRPVIDHLVKTSPGWGGEEEELERSWRGAGEV